MVEKIYNIIHLTRGWKNLVKTVCFDISFRRLTGIVKENMWLLNNFWLFLSVSFSAITSPSFQRTNMLFNDIKRDKINKFEIKYWKSIPIEQIPKTDRVTKTSPFDDFIKTRAKKGHHFSWPLEISYTYLASTNHHNHFHPYFSPTILYFWHQSILCSYRLSSDEDQQL